MSTASEHRPFGLQMLRTESLEPHPHNPRQDLGDLTELADSIRESGVMQNLTVVAGVAGAVGAPERYTVIIGHRRLAAAKLAGLEAVPCAVVDLIDREQIAVMLTENMQRADLTIAEQAHGIQLMLDLGDTVEDAARRTGFSESTIRRRAKLATLDAKKLRAGVERGELGYEMSDEERQFLDGTHEIFAEAEKVRKEN